jgi:hypothetical protein
MQDTRMKLQKCPNCLYEMDCSTGLRKEDSNPEPGSISICLKCGALCEFDQDMNLVPLTKDQLEEIKRTDPDAWRIIAASQSLIRARIKHN